MRTNAKTFILYERQINTLKEVIKPKTFILTEEQAKTISDMAEMTEWKFNSNIKQFLSDLLKDPIGAIVPNTLALNGYDKNSLIKELMGNDLLRKEEKIDDKDFEGNLTRPVMRVKYLVPKKNFDRKLKTLYIKTFESNLPEEQTLTEDGEGGGCGCAMGGDGCAMGSTTCGASSGQFTAPAFGVQRRKIKKYTDLDETTTCGSVGAFQYDAPAFGDDESLKRHNGDGGSVSVNQAE